MISPLSQQSYGSIHTNTPYSGGNQFSYSSPYQGSMGCHNSSCCPLEQAIYQIANDVVTGIQDFLQRTLDGLFEKLGLNFQNNSSQMPATSSTATTRNVPSMFDGLLQGVTSGINNLFSGGVSSVIDSGVKFVSSLF